MNTTVVIVDTASRTVLWLALIGSGLKLALAVAPRFQITAPKTPQVRVKVIYEVEAPKRDSAAEPAKTGPVPLERAS